MFETLIQHKIPVKLILLDTDYEDQTRIIELTDRKKTPHLILDIPEDFEKAAANVDVWQIHFEFTGPDHINYAFTTHGAEIADQRIVVKLPQELERKQRRELFRLDAPNDTRLYVLKGAHQLELQVMDISIGGSLAALVQTKADMPANSPFAIAQLLEDVVLEFPAEIMQRPIQIKTVQIKRITHNSETKRYEMGLEFCKISADEQKRLTDLIYKLQRQYLRHRLPLDL
ncbi:MAG: PilZ domain-containing protein [Desulfobacterales bacterium]